MFACSTYPAFDQAFLRSVRAEAEIPGPPPAPPPLHRALVREQRAGAGLVGERVVAGAAAHELARTTANSSTSSCPRSSAGTIPSAHTGPAARTPVRRPERVQQPGLRRRAPLGSLARPQAVRELPRTCHRFCSEFGFQSFPEPRTVRASPRPADRNVTSYVMEQHQRSGIGNSMIFQYMLDWFRLPQRLRQRALAEPDPAGRRDEVRRRALAPQHAAQHGRALLAAQRLLAGASWSSIDYYKRWKALHYMARRFYAPLLVSGVEDLKTGRVEAHATSDLLRRAKASSPGESPPWPAKTWRPAPAPCGCPRGRAGCVRTLDLKPHLDARGPRDLLLWLDLSVRGRPVFAQPRHLLAPEAPGARGPGDQARRLARRSRRLPRRPHRRTGRRSGPGWNSPPPTRASPTTSSICSRGGRSPRRAVARALLGSFPEGTPRDESEGYVSVNQMGDWEIGRRNLPNLSPDFPISRLYLAAILR